jgi:flagellar biosynthesis/type III secretory pathway protein FliH
LLKAGGLEMLFTILRYVSQVGSSVGSEKLEKAITAALPVEGGILKKTLAEQWLEEGREQGLKQGLERGREEGLAQGQSQALMAQRETLLLILRHRFPISDTALAQLTERINQVDALPRLVQWVNHALAADSLDAFITWIEDSPAQE